MPASSEISVPELSSESAGPLRAEVSELRGITLGLGVQAVADQLLFNGTSFLTTVIVARSCSLREIGLFHLVLSVLYVLRGIQSELVTAPFTVYRHRRQGNDLATYLGSLTIHQVGIAIVQAALWAALGWAAAWQLAPAGFATLMPAFVFIAPVLLLRDFIRQLSLARLDLRSALLIDGLMMVLQLGGLLFIVRRQSITASDVYFVLGASAAITCVTWWRVGRPVIRFDCLRVVPDFWENWAFSRWALASQLACACTPFFVTWLVQVLASEEAIGRLNPCISLCGPLTLFTTAMISILTPQAAQTYQAEGQAGLRRVAIRYTLLFTLVLGSLTLVMALLGDRIPVLVYGEKFRGTGVLVAWIALGCWLNSLAVVLGNVMWAVDHPRLNLPGDLVTSVSTIGLTVVLYAQLGIVGVPLATVIGIALGVAVRACLLWRRWPTFR